MAASLLTSSAKILIIFIEFSEVLAFLPMLRLNYTIGLKFFFKGISGFNFQMFDFAQYLSFLPFGASLASGGERFELAGFDTKSAFLNGADIILFCLVFTTSLCVHLTLRLLCGRVSYLRRRIN